jgi:hypothetical protein
MAALILSSSKPTDRKYSFSYPTPLIVLTLIPGKWSRYLLSNLYVPGIPLNLLETSPLLSFIKIISSK